MICNFLIEKVDNLSLNCSQGTTESSAGSFLAILRHVIVRGVEYGLAAQDIQTTGNRSWLDCLTLRVDDQRSE
jgi:hypothetical protein